MKKQLYSVVIVTHKQAQPKHEKKTFNEDPRKSPIVLLSTVII